MKYYINLCILFAHTKYPKLSIHFYYISFHVYSTFYILQYFLHFFAFNTIFFPLHYKILTKYQSITFSFKLKRKRKKLYFQLYIQLTSFFPPTKYTPLIFHSPIHFSPMPFKKKGKKKPYISNSTTLIPLLSHFTSFSKPIYTNNRRNCLKNRFNFHRKLTPSVILTPSLTREPIKQMENGGKTRKFVWNVTRHILVYSI